MPLQALSKMKRALLFFFLPIALSAQTLVRLPGPGGAGGGAFVVTQHVTLNSTSCNGTATCSITVASTGSGHPLNISATLSTTGGGATLSSVSDNQTETWTQASSFTTQYNYSGSNWKTNLDAYVLSSTAGVTTVTFKTTSNVANWSLEFTELASGGLTVYYDTANAVQDTTCTSCAGVGLTLSGSNDAILQVGNTTAAVSSISGGAGYGIIDIDTQTHAGYAIATNTNNGSAPTWTTTSGYLAASAIAFTATAPPSLAFVESVGATTNGSTSTITNTLGTNTTSSNEDIGVAVFSAASTGCTTTGTATVTDSASQTYTFIWGTFTTGTSGGGCIELWHKSSSASGVSSVSVTLATGNLVGGALAWHVKGVLTGNDATATSKPSTTSQGTPWTGTSVSTSGNTEFMVAITLSVLHTYNSGSQNSQLYTGSWTQGETICSQSSTSPCSVQNAHLDGANGNVFGFAYQS